MNVTGKKIKRSQSQIKESSPQKDSAERESYVGVRDSLRITENNITNANAFNTGLLEQILERTILRH